MDIKRHLCQKIVPIESLVAPPSGFDHSEYNCDNGKKDFDKMKNKKKVYDLLLQS